MNIPQAIKDLIAKAAATQEPGLIRDYGECFYIIDAMFEGIKDTTSGIEDIERITLAQKTPQLQNKIRELVLEACALFIEAAKQGKMTRTHANN